MDVIKMGYYFNQKHQNEIRSFLLEVLALAGIRWNVAHHPMYSRNAAHQITNSSDIRNYFFYYGLHYKVILFELEPLESVVLECLRWDVVYCPMYSTNVALSDYEFLSHNKLFRTLQTSLQSDIILTRCTGSACFCSSPL